MSSPITVGIVGFGLASSVFHAPLLQSDPHFSITHVVERSTSKSADLTPAPTIVRSLDELLTTSVELVVIATPTNLHYEQAKQVILAKKHVVVDKPLCVTAAEAQELTDLAKTNQVVFSIFQNRRWDSDFLTIQKLIHTQKVGQVTHYEAHYDRYRPTLKGYWREKAIPGAGNLYDLGAHLVDQAIVLFGVPDQVHADVQIQRELTENDDYFHLEFVYTALPHLKVILTAGMLVQELGPKYIVQGTTGRIEKYGEDIQEASLKSGIRPGMEQWGIEPSTTQAIYTSVDGTTESIPTERGCYETFYANIAAAIRHHTELFVQPADIVERIRILENAKKTLRINRIQSNTTE